MQLNRTKIQRMVDAVGGTGVVGGSSGDGMSIGQADSLYVSQAYFNQAFSVAYKTVVTVTDGTTGEETTSTTISFAHPNIIVEVGTTTTTDPTTGDVTTTTVSLLGPKVLGNLLIGDSMLEWDATNSALRVINKDGKTAASFYATGGVSALGYSPGGGGGGGATTLADLFDVQLTNPTNGQALVYNSVLGKWVNGTGGGSVTSVGLSAPTGFEVSGSPVTGSGTLTLRFATGYSLPTTSQQEQWNTAYGWGNHATAGYATQTWVQNQNYATQSWVQGRGYITASALNGYATQSWVQSQGYLTDAMKNFLSPDSDLDSLTDSGSYRLDTGNTHKPTDDNYAQLLVVRGGYDTAAQIFFPYGRSTAYLRTGNPLNASGSWKAWKEMAFTDSNVASATKLQTARLLWGNSFDGTANVGDSTTRKGLSYVSNIMMTGSIGSDAGDHLQNIYMTYFIYGPRGIEMNKYGGESGNGGFIDFHYAGSSADYTARIIEDSTNVVSIYAKNSSGTMVAPTLQVGPGNYASSLRIGNAVLSWDSTNNALKVSKYDGTAVNLYALGGVSALGFSNGVNQSISISTLTANTLNTQALNMANESRIYTDESLYIGSPNSDGWVYLADCCSQQGESYWLIGEDGHAVFNAYVRSPKFYLDNTRYLQYSGGHLQFYNGTSFINLT